MGTPVAAITAGLQDIGSHRVGWLGAWAELCHLLPPLDLEKPRNSRDFGVGEGVGDLKYLQTLKTSVLVYVLL